MIRISRTLRARISLIHLQGREIKCLSASGLRLVICVWSFLLAVAAAHAQTTPAYKDIRIGDDELSRPARPWEFLDAVGKRSGLFGNESGRFEAWVYPLKIFRDFDVTFVLNNRRIPASSLVRRLTVRPEGPTLTFASDSFTVNETWLTPPEESGAIIRFEINTWEPLEIEASFTRDFQLMWPAGLGGTYMGWNSELHAYEFGEQGRKFAAVMGSPSAETADPEFFSNSYSTAGSTFRLGPTPKGSDVKYIVIAGATDGIDSAIKTYQHLAESPSKIFTAAKKYYDDYLAHTLSLDLPDPQLQAAYDWSRISTIQGLVENPFLGTGLVAGYGRSAESARPGYAWFFGRDSLWTDLALDSIGDFTTVRTALDFIAKYQRQDGKVEHEISQTASLVNWWTGFPYAYASADATPLFLIAMNDYVKASGDVAFAKQHWDNITRAYQFLKSTYDANGLPRNFGVGHGWIEGGPLLPVETESYQSGLAVAALDACASLTGATGLNAVAPDINEAKNLRQKVNDAFWDAADHTLVFAIDQQSKQVTTPTVLSTAPMWFDVFNGDKANATIDHLADWDSSTDWGMRIISVQHPLFGPTGYHFGAVWPLFTGWAAVAEYRNHRPLEAYANLQANALLALDGSLGHVTEVLSGSYYEGLGTASPHQIWSSAMVLSPIVRGMLGYSEEGGTAIRFAPHLPISWNHVGLHSLPLCGDHLDLDYARRADGIHLQVKTKGPQECTIEFSPSVSLHAKVMGVTWKGKRANYKVEPNANDQHVSINLPWDSGEAVIRVGDDFGLEADEDLPPLGSESSNLKISHEEWSADKRQLTLRVAALEGRTCRLRAYGARIASVEGGKLTELADGGQTIEIAVPGESNAKYVSREVVIRF